MLENVFLCQFFNTFAKVFKNADVSKEDYVANQPTLFDRNLDRAKTSTHLERTRWLNWFKFCWSRCKVSKLIIGRACKFLKFLQLSEYDTFYTRFRWLFLDFHWLGKQRVWRGQDRAFSTACCSIFLHLTLINHWHRLSLCLKKQRRGNLALLLND